MLAFPWFRAAPFKMAMHTRTLGLAVLGARLGAIYIDGRCNKFSRPIPALGRQAKGQFSAVRPSNSRPILGEQFSIDCFRSIVLRSEALAWPTPSHTHTHIHARSRPIGEKWFRFGWLLELFVCCVGWREETFDGKILFSKVRYLFHWTWVMNGNAGRMGVVWEKSWKVFHLFLSVAEQPS